MNIANFLDNPVDFLIGLLVSLPGVLIALSAHEAAHGWVAWKCGDPTAKYYGRVTLNPLRHIDPVGFLCMVLMGFGWAKPVPVNPNNFRSYRRDDLKVSLAGISANLLLCLLSALIMVVFLVVSFLSLPRFDSVIAYAQEHPDFALVLDEGRWMLAANLKEGFFAFTMNDIFSIASGFWQYSLNGAGYGVIDLFISPALGSFMGYVYRALTSFAALNLALAIFNLIPVPPLDGYHVLNDLILKKPLFAPAKAARIGSGILFALILIGNYNEKLDVIGIAMNFVRHNVLDGLMSLAHTLLGAFGLF